MVFGTCSQLVTSYLFVILLIGLSINWTSGTPVASDWSHIDRELLAALELQKVKDGHVNESDGPVVSENRNQGLINTIVNHNNKMKQIDNRLNVVINNYANSSHIKEIIEKTKEVERHVFGPPQPHRSWRELVLLIIVVVAVIFCLIKVVKKYLAPWLIRSAGVESKQVVNKVSTISGYVSDRQVGYKHAIDELKRRLEEQNSHHNEQLSNMTRMLGDIATMVTDLEQGGAKNVIT